MNMRLRGVILCDILGAAIWLLIGLAAFGADVSVTWVPPSNVDNTPLSDYAGTRLWYAPILGKYSESNKIVTSLIIGYGPTNYFWIEGATNATKVTLPSGWYSFWLTGFSTSGDESDPSSNLTKRVGRISTMKFESVK